MAGNNTHKAMPKGRAANPNPLRDIRHASGFHARVVDTRRPRDPSQLTKLDDLCLGCFELTNECVCNDEGLDDG